MGPAAVLGLGSTNRLKLEIAIRSRLVNWIQKLAAGLWIRAGKLVSAHLLVFSSSGTGYPTLTPKVSALPITLNSYICTEWGEVISPLLGVPPLKQDEC